MHVALVDLRWDGHHTPYVVLLTRYFTGRGHPVTFITRRENPRLDELPDADDFSVRALDLPSYPDDSPEGLVSSVREQRVRVAQLFDIYEAAIEGGADVVHLLYFDRTQVPFQLATKRSSIDFPPTVATLHRDAFLDNSDRSLPKAATRFVTRWALDAVLRDGRLGCLTVHANSVRDRIIGAVSGATRANTRTIPAPTPEFDIEGSQSAARERLGLPSDARIVLFFGGLRQEKGPDVLAAALRSVDGELTAVFAGSGDDFTQADVDEWKRAVPDAVTIEDRIEFIPEADVNDYFVAADVLALPYRRTRGISGPLRRAAWASTPVIGNRHSDVGDLIEQHNLGWTFESRAELAELLSSFDPDATGERTAALERFARSRHWSRTGNQLLEIYADVTG